MGGKLVRDKIPQLIRAGGGVADYRILSRDEYAVCLEAKLDEEVAEYHAEPSMEELADILEVVLALADLQEGREKLKAVWEAKHLARGGFEDRIFLITDGSE